MNVFKVEFAKISKGLLTWTLSLAGIMFMYILFFPSMKDLGFDELMASKMSLLPDAVKEAFGLKNMPDFTVYVQYIAYILQYVIIGVSIYALILGAKALASEEQDKTIEFQMANPISRNKLITTKLIVGFIAVTILMIAILLTCLAGGAMYAKAEYIMSITTIVKMSIIPAYIYLFIGFMLSAVLKKTLATPGTALGIFFGTYIIGIMAGVIDKISWMKYLSPANYVMAADVLKSNLVDSSKAAFNMTGIYIGIVIIIVSSITTYVVYNKKDMDI